ncbi:MAG: hypothetical protein ACYC1C_07605 [Chloroflexota bacterium]
MLIRQKAEITIRDSRAELVYDYASDPVNWSASNPEEHFGLVFHSEDNRPHTGVTFRQRESVAGVYADLRGHFLHVVRPKIAVWTGLATYKLSFLGITLPEGGVIQIEETPAGVRLSHAVFIDFPENLLGRIALWFFIRRNVEQELYHHTYKELVFFKSKLEA